MVLQAVLQRAVVLQAVQTVRMPSCYWQEARAGGIHLQLRLQQGRGLPT
jgi:hypothetical protein